VLEYREFRDLTATISKAREACVKSGHAVSNHFVVINEMVGIGSGAQRELDGLKQMMFVIGVNCQGVLETAGRDIKLLAVSRHRKIPGVHCTDASRKIFYS
jgi:hypothetical protein